MKVSKVENIRNRYNQVPHLTQDTNGKVLVELNLPTLPYRRRGADLIQVFKIIKGIDDIPIDNFFQISESTTRGLNHMESEINTSKFIFGSNS